MDTNTEGYQGHKLAYSVIKGELHMLHILITLISFSLGSCMGVLFMAMLSAGGRADMCETCLNGAQMPLEGIEEVKTTSRLSSPIEDEEAGHMELESIPKHEPMRKKDKRPHFKKCKKHKKHRCK